ncbi:MAG: DUF2169 domain-containing protein [Nitrospira sp.]|uniref:DUF2169 family type VI secretion system accessory protein n=1 Tax=Thauera sp. 2A1 TaxID=2570191 RepID=UPI00129108FC|nr:DUF2169 domain-containing protein [Thauera sp. 2A1]KAI5916440.1 DUF2169 domain-containing protein [Thauera sp. 2A1]MBS0173718.1 DUF2169 domain-containing protein [Nitrospira sp.]
MWNLSNSTPYAAIATLAADRDGHDLWITVVKATFDVVPDGSVERAAEQLPVVFAPLFAGDPSRSSLLAESDIDYAKAGVDVLVQGTVHAPQGKPAQEVLVGLDVDGRRKILRVHGERQWIRRAGIVGLSEAQLFTEMPLTYEFAFGGFDPVDENDHDERNPAGRGYAKKSSRLVDRPAPRIEYVDNRADGPQPRPAGFGPVARHWLPRRTLAGTYDDKWKEERLPLLPTDFDERFFLAAPEDQQFTRLPQQALVRVAGMSADGSQLTFRIPRIALALNIQIGNREVNRRPSLRTVLVLPDSRRVVVTYADAMPCSGEKFSIVDTEVVEKRFIQ